jgi:glutamyl-tRNA reductase
MALTFNSKTIKKVISIDELDHLSNPELELVEQELETAIKTMNESMADIAEEKHSQGLKPDSDWLVRIKRKQQICDTFLQKIQVNLTMNNSEFVKQKYQQNLNKLLQKALGTKEFDAIKFEAQNITFEEVINSKSTC